MIKIPTDIARLFDNHQKKIDKILNITTNLFTEKFRGINHSQIKKFFWRYVHQEGIECKNLLDEWYMKFAIMMVHIITEEILVLDKRVDLVNMDFFHQVSTYIFNRFLPHVKNIPPKYTACTIFNLPWKNLPQVQQLMDELLNLHKEGDLSVVILNPDINLSSKIRKFKDEFSRMFELVSNRCGEMAKIWLPNENPEKYNDPDRIGNDLYHIFQLRNNSINTPPQLVEKVLLEFIHIRNAISHSGNAGIFPEDANHIRIIDKKPNGEISYEFTHHHHKLWSFYYWLITFDRAITTAVLMVHVADEIALMNEKYVVNLKCFYCRRTFEVFLPPWVSSVKCLKCGRTLIPNSS